MPVHALLVDDHPLFRAGLRVALDSAGGIHVVGEAPCAAEAVRLAADLRPDVVVMDLRLPDGSGVECIRRITEGAGPPRVLVLSMSEDDDAVVAALRAGARGYLVKGSGREETVRAVLTVAAGGAVFSPVVAARLASYFSAVHDVPCRAAFPELTDREREILDLIARGHDNHQIARRLVLADKTVRNHVSNVFAKLGVTDRTRAAVRARDAGLGR